MTFRTPPQSTTTDNVEWDDIQDDEMRRALDASLIEQVRISRH